MTCWEESPAPTFPTKVDGRDAEALLDTGNTVSLIQPQLVGEHNRTPENPVAVSCIHGDTKEYPTAVVKLTTPQGNCQLQVGLVPNIPGPLLVGHVCPLFSKLSGKQEVWCNCKKKSYLWLGGKPNRPHKNPSNSRQNPIFALPRGTRMGPPLSQDQRKS